VRNRTLAAISIVSFLGFVLLAAAVRYFPSVDQTDFNAALWVNGLSVGPALNSLFVAAALYGREEFWIPVVGLIFLVGDKRSKLLAVGLASLFIIGIFAGEVAKGLIMRERIAVYIADTFFANPFTFTLRVPFDTDFAFPSGHALIVSIGAIYSLVTFRKKWAASLLTVEAAVVCFSRVYVGAHYPADVIGGVLLGAAIVFAGLAIEQRYLRRFEERIGAYIERVFGIGPLHL
jgi:membrane-associated phospholipid phosphatase